MYLESNNFSHPQPYQTGPSAPLLIGLPALTLVSYRLSPRSMILLWLLVLSNPIYPTLSL